MNENWQEIVSILRPHFENNSTEDVYQREIESCLQILGWKRYNRSLLSQCTLPIGNNNSIRLDVLLRKNEMNVLPIEIKRPSNICNERQELQLMSYMRQLRVNVGLYVGEKIRLYYDNPEDSMDAVCVFSAKIDNEDTNGIKLCELLEFASFDKDAFEVFCRKEYESMQTRRNLHQLFSEYFSADKCVANLQSLVKEHFLADGYDEFAIEEAMKSLQIAVTYSPRINIMQRGADSNESQYATIRNINPLASISDSAEKKRGYTRTAPTTTLKVTFSDGTVIFDNSAIEVERQFIIRVGVERVKALGITQCREDLVGVPATTRNPGKYSGRWKYLEDGYYIFTCSNNGDKMKHINKIIDALGIDAVVELIV